jgi:predicted ATPase
MKGKTTVSMTPHINTILVSGVNPKQETKSRVRNSATTASLARDRIDLDHGGSSSLFLSSSPLVLKQQGHSNSHHFCRDSAGQPSNESSSSSLDFSPSSCRRRISALSLSSTGAGGGSNSLSSTDFEVLVRSSERQKQERINSIITANQLRFDRLRGLCGRDHEIETLKSCLGRLRASQPAEVTAAVASAEAVMGNGFGQREVVFIHGPSGVGKSAIARELQKPVEQMNGVYCCGKYDLNLHDQPFVGIKQVCNELCQKVALKDKQEQRRRMRKVSESIPADSKAPSSSSFDDYISISERLEKEMGEENIEVLSNVVNQIQLLVGKSAVNTNTIPPIPEEVVRENGRRQSFQDSGGVEKKRDRLIAAFRLFFKVICSYMKDGPVVLFLDDLQWADSSSFDVLKMVATDSSECYRMMIIGCYRSDETMDDDHLLRSAIHSLRDRKNDPTGKVSEFLTITDIQVGTLSLEHVREMLSELLSKDQSEVQQLAELCKVRTQGNVFFLRAFLTMLVQEGFLKFHIGTFQWDWNIVEIENETSVTANLVDLIQARMMRMDRNVVELIKFAACLGHTFDKEILRLVWTHLKRTGHNNGDDDDSNSTIDFETCLQNAVQQSCLVAAPLVEVSDLDSSKHRKVSMTSLAIVEATSGLYRFSHDKVQESAISLIPDDDFATLQYAVGMVLLQYLQPDDLESMLFVVANLVNCKLSTTDEVNVANATVNLKAASRARDIAAFSTVIRFVRAGIKHLSSSGYDMWTQQYSDVAFELHSLGATAEQLLGNNDEAIQYCTKILSQRGATTLQKCVVYKVKLDMLHNTPGKSMDALALCMEYLSEVGCQFPKQRLVRRAMVGPYVKETKAHYIPTLAEIRTLPLVSDLVVLEVVQLLERAANLAYLCLDRDLYVLIRCRFVRMVRTYGLSEMAGAAFASFANVLMHEYGMSDMAIQLADASLVIQSILPSQFYRGRTLITANFYVYGWVRPLHSRLKYFIEGYELGIRAGNTLTISTSLMFFLNAELAAGTSLHLLQQDLQIYVPQLRLINGMHSDAILPIWQLCDNLMGKSSNTTLLIGDIWDENLAMALGRPYFDAMYPRYKVSACCHFSEYETGAKVVLEVGGINALKKFPGVGFGMECLPFGVCCFAAAGPSSSSSSTPSTTRIQSRSKYRKLAENVRTEARALVKNGCVNLIHVVSLLDAEHYALNGKVDKAMECYNKATTEAARGGFLSSAAIANKRFSDFLSSTGGGRRNNNNNNDKGGVGSSEEAKHRHHEAIRYYNEWGATAVATLLCRQSSR